MVVFNAKLHVGFLAILYVRQLLAMCHYIDGPMHMNRRPKPRPTMFPSVYMNGVSGIGHYWRLFTASNTCT